MINTKRLGAIATLIAGALIMTGCMLVPGKFTSELALHRDGTFTYRYDGEIYLMAMSQLAEASARLGSNTDNEFTPQPCFGDDWSEEDGSTQSDLARFADAFVEPAEDAAEEEASAKENYGLTVRECTEAELAEQRQDHTNRLERRKKEAEQQAQVMNLFFGGLDPSDPKSADELVKRLQRQRGWKKVENLGGGKFNVSFELTATMSHDFVFPTFERFPMNNFLLTAAVREPGTVRIDAPGFAVQGGNGPMGGMMSGMLGVMQIFGDQQEKDSLNDIPELEGKFAILTDGRILANNTDEGPMEANGVERLEWEITSRTRVAPMALIALD